MATNKDKKIHQVCVKLTESQYKEFQEMADKAERTLADFMRIATQRYINIKKESDEI